MIRVQPFLAGAGLAVVLAAPLYSQPVRAPNVGVTQVIKQPGASQPTRIVRKPAVYKVQARPITNRVVSNAALQNLISRGAVLQLKQPAAPPGKLALVVIMENGGIMNNVDPALRQALNHNIRTVTCGEWEFELSAGETIPDLIGRLGSQLLGNAACVNPGNWRQENFNPLAWLNEQTDLALENAIKAQNSLLNTQNEYDQVIVLEDADATPARVIAAMRSLAPTHVMDVHVLTHGGQDFFVGRNANFTSGNFFTPLKAETDARRMFIRSVYQMNCFSSTLKDDWRSLGAVVVNGTQNATLNNMPHQYFHFLGHWLHPRGMSDSSQRSFDDAALYTRPIYSLVGMGNKVDVSRLTATGSNVNASVNTAL